MIRIRCKDQELYPVGVFRRLCFGRVDLPVPGGPEGLLVQEKQFDDGEWTAIKSDPELIVEAAETTAGDGGPESPTGGAGDGGPESPTGGAGDEERKSRRRK